MKKSPEVELFLSKYGMLRLLLPSGRVEYFGHGNKWKKSFYSSKHREISARSLRKFSVKVGEL